MNIERKDDYYTVDAIDYDYVEKSFILSNETLQDFNNVNYKIHNKILLIKYFNNNFIFGLTDHWKGYELGNNYKTILSAKEAILTFYCLDFLNKRTKY